ncbi:unnamed protein product [Cylindrotheca closterium]|uniref:Uncharacterized protein n=1 Tax=Cylindrotheca closterium TaxID=2856 RepID=A0AAD2FML6_9STRA|nr:unnamed protein product [Cylindrotheca closterium]
MIHFDAHPDLACPTSQCPAVSCFTPRKEMTLTRKNLYELLDLSETGIAEWIIPLVVAAELKTINWVKPGFSSQFPLGRHLYNVGAYHDDDNDANDSAPSVQSFLDLPDTAIIKTDFDMPYYQDDGAVVESASDLLLAQQLELVVTELPTTQTLLNHRDGDDDDNTKKWALDICLDYFACQNPFLSDIDKVNPAVTKALLQVMSAAEVGPGRTSADLKQLVAAMLEDGNSIPNMDPLAKYFDSAETANDHLTALKRFTDQDSSLRSLVLKAIPNWDMPHDVPSADKEKILEAIRDMEEALSKEDCTSPPFLITICRSSDDEFTPPWLVEFIQVQVLELLDRIFYIRSTGEPQSLCIVKDYGEWEGSTI